MRNLETLRRVEAANAALKGVQEMIYKEENILLPMSLETPTSRIVSSAAGS
jgi:DUF438 domain-containing protein